MSNPQLALLMLGLFIFIIMLGFPIAFTLMAMVPLIFATAAILSNDFLNSFSGSHVLRK